MKALARIIRQHPLEIAKGFCCVIKNNRVCDALASVGAGNEVINAPAVALRILVIGLSIRRVVNGERLSRRIAAGLLDLPAQIRGDAHNILHQFIWITENMGVDLLQQKIIAAAVFLKMEDICVVDMTVVDPIITGVVATQLELTLDLLNLEGKLAHV